MILDGTIVAILATGAAELARHAPDIQRAVVDFVREHKDVIKDVVKGGELKKMGDSVKDYVTHGDSEGGWDKK